MRTLSTLIAGVDDLQLPKWKGRWVIVNVLWELKESQGIPHRFFGGHPTAGRLSFWP